MRQVQSPEVNSMGFIHINMNIGPEIVPIQLGGLSVSHPGLLPCRLNVTGQKQSERIAWKTKQKIKDQFTGRLGAKEKHSYNDLET